MRCVFCGSLGELPERLMVSKHWGVLSCTECFQAGWRAFRQALPRKEKLE